MRRWLKLVRFGGFNPFYSPDLRLYYDSLPDWRKPWYLRKGDGLP